MHACQKWATGLYLAAIPLFSFAQQDSAKVSKKIEKWFPKYDFSTAAFQQPATAFAPFARWWLAGKCSNQRRTKKRN